MIDFVVEGDRLSLWITIQVRTRMLLATHQRSYPVHMMMIHYVTYQYSSTGAIQRRIRTWYNSK